MTSKQKRMKKAVEYLQDYMATYDKQGGYLDYSDETLIEDVLYGLGVALGPKQYAFAQGFRRFKERLAKHLANAKDHLRDGGADNTKSDFAGTSEACCYAQVIVKMHDDAARLESEGAALLAQRKLHDAHSHFDTAKCLRTAANYIDGTVCA